MSAAIRTFACVLVVALFPSAVFAESVVELLSGFDAARIDAAYPPANDDQAGELAKLMYRVRLADQAVVNARASQLAGAQIGDAAAIEGEIREVRVFKVPERLIEFLELTLLQVVDIASEDGDVRIVTTDLPRAAKPGDRVSGVGVLLDDGNKSGTPALASAHLRWFPDSPETTGWQLLGNAGMDISLLPDLSSRSRQPLTAQDGDAFYASMSAAAQVGQQADLPAPDLVEPVQLLRSPSELTGHWLRMNLETVQFTRISVTDRVRQAQLGSDHYWQIDAMGDLGNVVVKIERPDGDAGPPAVFENRYPVSVVVRELPEFLIERIRAQEGGDAVVCEMKTMVGADVFFLRLWSYTTDFMKQHGGGEQFGPLLVAAQIRDREPTAENTPGVGVIAWIAATAIVGGILVTWIWNRRLAARDLQIRERRKDRESEQLQLP